MREGRSLMEQVGWEEQEHPEAGLREALGGSSSETGRGRIDVAVDAFRVGQQEWGWLIPGGLNLPVQIGGEVHIREPMGKSRGCGGRWTWT